MAHKPHKSPKQDTMMKKKIVLGVSSYNQASYNQSSAQKVYVESNNSKKQFFLMCVGLTHGGSSLFDLNADPWKPIKKQDVKPSRFEYAQEVSRLVTLLDMERISKMANWGSTKCIKWLEANPLKDEQDVLFSKNEVQRLKTIILEAQQKGKNKRHGKREDCGEFLSHTYA
jgi:hypothetical protein